MGGSGENWEGRWAEEGNETAGTEGHLRGTMETWCKIGRLILTKSPNNEEAETPTGPVLGMVSSN